MRLVFKNCVPCISVERAAQNIAHAKALGLPEYRQAGALGRRLAVVGGGPSLYAKINELAEFDDVWAINGMAAWLGKRGIASTMLSVDSKPMLAPMCAGVKKALLSWTCDTSVFDALAGAEVEIFKPGPGGRLSGATTATAAPSLAASMGYREVVFFGCESSMLLGEPNVYRAFEEGEADLWLSVRVGGEPFYTVAEFLMQAECLAEIIRTFPEVFKERSGGLLGALVRCGLDYELIAASEEIQAGLQPLA